MRSGLGVWRWQQAWASNVVASPAGDEHSGNEASPTSPLTTQRTHARCSQPHLRMN